MIKITFIQTNGVKKSVSIDENEKISLLEVAKQNNIEIMGACDGACACGTCHIKIDKEHFGEIEDVTDKGYYTNSYHVDVRQKIDAFEKLSFESEFQNISLGGCISYVEIPSIIHNLKALEELVKFMYDNIQYAEFNTRFDYCHCCGFNGEIMVNEENRWECPNCGNKNTEKLTVIRRTCGYLGLHFWNEGKTKEMKQRVLHL